MHILVLLTDLFDSIGGIQTFNRCLMKALNDISQKEGIKVTIFALNDSNKARLPEKYNPSGSMFYKGFSKNKFYFTARSIIESLSTNKIIIGHLSYISIVSLFFNFIKPASKILIIYGIEAWKRLNFIQSLGVKKIDRILSVSQYTTDKFCSMNNLDQSRFLGFPNSLDPYYLNGNITLKNRKDLNLPTGNIILTVSRLDSQDNYKNIDLVINAMPYVLKAIPDAYYVIVGDGTDRKRLEQITKKISISDKVIFTGNVPANLLSSYYNACDVFVLPSTKEGLGMVFLEAMYFSKPCIGVKAGGLPEVIKDGKTGILCEPGNIKELSDSIVMLLKDKSLSAELGSMGKELFDKEFSYAKFKERLENVLCTK